MDDPSDIADPSDWLRTSVPLIAPLETALRCQVCKDFYDTPMVTSCSHTFCSLCIRRCLTTDGKCPMCRAADQELRLRRNWTAQEMVDAFLAARPSLMQMGKKQNSRDHGQGLQMREKRKMAELGIDDGGEDTLPRSRRMKTRSQREDGVPSSRTESNHVTGDDIIELDSEQSEDDLKACPICGKRMQEEEVFSHLDIHMEKNNNAPAKSSAAGNSLPAYSPIKQSASSKAPERLPQLSYSLLKDNALRKKLSELGIPNGGPRAQLVKRHTEWINLVNANCDSSKPRSKRELLHDLEVWDKSQGRQIANNNRGLSGGSSVMRKDFDGAAWATAHVDDFQKLISMARRKEVPHDAQQNHIQSPNMSGQDHSLDAETSDADQFDKPIDNVHDTCSPEQR